MNMVNKTNCREAVLVNIQSFKDDAVFEVLYKKYWDTLLNFAKKYLADTETCKEIVQELFVTLHLKRNTITVNVSLSSYLFTSLRNKIINHLRNETLYKKHLSIAGRAYLNITTGNEGELLMDVWDLEKQIVCCLNKMPGKYREVYMLTMQQANTIKVTAEILQRPVSTVERQLRISVKLMQEYLNKRSAYLH
jgi:RNA polymerase sigma-70 factor (ECF subfamily)